MGKNPGKNILIYVNYTHLLFESLYSYIFYSKHSTQILTNSHNFKI